MTNILCPTLVDHNIIKTVHDVRYQYCHFVKDLNMFPSNVLVLISFNNIVFKYMMCVATKIVNTIFAFFLNFFLILAETDLELCKYVICPATLKLE